jgi:hypothetical protein
MSDSRVDNVAGRMLKCAINIPDSVRRIKKSEEDDNTIFRNVVRDDRLGPFLDSPG